MSQTPSPIQSFTLLTPTLGMTLIALGVRMEATRRDREAFPRRGRGRGLHRRRPAITTCLAWWLGAGTTPAMGAHARPL